MPKTKEWDDDLEKFVEHPEVHLSFEHSLISISKWESRWHKPFLDTNNKDPEELMDYIACMCITQNVTTEKIKGLPKEVISQINDYINDPHTGTTFQDYRTPEKKNNKYGSNVMTSERIYYSMIAYNIPFTCEKWHLNRLMTLIRICSIEAENQNPKSKKMSMSEIYARNRKLNEERRRAWNTKG